MVRLTSISIIGIQCFEPFFYFFGLLNPFLEKNFRLQNMQCNVLRCEKTYRNLTFPKWKRDFRFFIFERMMDKFIYLFFVLFRCTWCMILIKEMSSFKVFEIKDSNKRGTRFSPKWVFWRFGLFKPLRDKTREMQQNFKEELPVFSLLVNKGTFRSDCKTCTKTIKQIRLVQIKYKKSWIAIRPLITLYGCDGFMSTVTGMEL